MDQFNHLQQQQLQQQQQQHQQQQMQHPVIPVPQRPVPSQVTQSLQQFQQQRQQEREGNSKQESEQRRGVELLHQARCKMDELILHVVVLEKQLWGEKETYRTSNTNHRNLLLQVETARLARETEQEVLQSVRYALALCSGQPAPEGTSGSAKDGSTTNVQSEVNNTVPGAGLFRNEERWREGEGLGKGAFVEVFRGENWGNRGGNMSEMVSPAVFIPRGEPGGPSGVTVWTNVGGKSREAEMGMTVLGKRTAEAMISQENPQENLPERNLVNHERELLMRARPMDKEGGGGKQGDEESKSDGEDHEDEEGEGEGGQKDSSDSEDSPETQKATQKVQQPKRKRAKLPETVAILDSLKDGWNWRKYGEKDTLGSNFSRNYYRCSLKCGAKRLVEKCSETPILYKVTYQGNHDHPKPEPKAPSMGGRGGRTPPSQAVPQPQIGAQVSLSVPQVSPTAPLVSPSVPLVSPSVPLASPQNENQLSPLPLFPMAQGGAPAVSGSSLREKLGELRRNPDSSRDQGQARRENGESLGGPSGEILAGSSRGSALQATVKEGFLGPPNPILPTQQMVLSKTSSSLSPIIPLSSPSPPPQNQKRNLPPLPPSIFQAFGQLFPTSNPSTAHGSTEPAQFSRAGAGGAALTSPHAGGAEERPTGFTRVLWDSGVKQGGLESNENNGGQDSAEREKNSEEEEAEEVNVELQLGIGGSCNGKGWGNRGGGKGGDGGGGMSGGPNGGQSGGRSQIVREGQRGGGGNRDNQGENRSGNVDSGWRTPGQALDESTTPRVEIPGTHGFGLTPVNSQKKSDISPTFFGLSPLYSQFTPSIHPE